MPVKDYSYDYAGSADYSYDYSGGEDYTTYKQIRCDLCCKKPPSIGCSPCRCECCGPKPCPGYDCKSK